LYLLFGKHSENFFYFYSKIFCFLENFKILPDKSKLFYEWMGSRKIVSQSFNLLQKNKKIETLRQ